MTGIFSVNLIVTFVLLLSCACARLGCVHACVFCMRVCVVVCMWVFLHVSLCVRACVCDGDRAWVQDPREPVLHGGQSSRGKRKTRDSWGFGSNLWRLCRCPSWKDGWVHLPRALSHMCTFWNCRCHPGHFGKGHTLLSGWKERSPWKPRAWIAC